MVQNGANPRGPRCIALVGPFQSGKTTLLEAILARTGAIQRQGTVDAGTTVGGLVAFLPDPSATPSGPIGAGLIVVGLVTILVGGVTTAQGTDLMPVVPPPPPPAAPTAPHAGGTAALSVGWAWRF